MQTVEETLTQARESKNITLKTASETLHIKQEILKALEEGDWLSLPEPPFLKGFLTTYARFLNLEPNHILALYRREFDEAKYQKPKIKNKSLHMFTPTKFINIVFFTLFAAFIIYIFIQYFSILSAPKVQIFTPPSDITTAVPVVKVSGHTEKDVTISISGELAPVDADGNFTKEVKLHDGANNIEVIASHKLSPKTRIIRVVRLIS